MSDDRRDPAVVLDLLADTPWIPADQLVAFGYFTGNGARGRGRWTGFGWYQPPSFGIAAMRLYGHGDGSGVRLLTFPHSTVRTLLDEGRCGRLDQAGYVLGLLVDVDSNERRLHWPPGWRRWGEAQVRAFYDEISDDDERGQHFRPYVPTVAVAVELASAVATPTIALDGGGGAPLAYLLNEPLAVDDAEWIGRLNDRFTAAIGSAVRADGWHFDSPPGFGWLRLPGSHRTALTPTGYGYGGGGHVVSVLSTGRRYSVAEIEAIAGPDTGPTDRWWAYEADADGWNGRPIPRPSGRRNEGVRWR